VEVATWIYYLREKALEVGQQQGAFAVRQSSTIRQSDTVTACGGCLPGRRAPPLPSTPILTSLPTPLPISESLEKAMALSTRRLRINRRGWWCRGSGDILWGVGGREGVAAQGKVE
jgi:hypothetical protein